MCSTLSGEQLAGTAKGGKIILALEYPRGWGRDILDGDALGAELSTKLKKFLKDNGAELQFIRRPGRAGQRRDDDPSRVLYISWATGEADPTKPILERLTVHGPEDLLELDLTGPGRIPSAIRVDHPLLLICTHGRRDQCCAMRGRPLAAALAKRFSGGDEIWESSHTKGHRFAPSMLLLPANYSFGHLAPNGATEVLQKARQGELRLLGNRGRGIHDVPAQVAELEVARMMADDGLTVGLASLTVEEVGAATRTGSPKSASRLVTDTCSQRAWRVDLELRDGVQVISSCGDAPKQSRFWVAVSVEPVS